MSRNTSISTETSPRGARFVHFGGRAPIREFPSSNVCKHVDGTFPAPRRFRVPPSCAHPLRPGRPRLLRPHRTSGGEDMCDEVVCVALSLSVNVCVCVCAIVGLSLCVSGGHHAVPPSSPLRVQAWTGTDIHTNIPSGDRPSSERATTAGARRG